MATADRNDPYAGFNFILDIGDGSAAGFSEVTGLDTDTDIIEYRNGDEKNPGKAKLPGLHKYSNITLKRGFTNNQALWNWRKTVLDGKAERRSGSITLLNEARQPALRFNFTAAWPAKWQGPALHAGNSEVAIETLEIACEKIELVTA
ncbi:phage tail protein [Mesorhizobium sp. LSJC269B00]|uniref:phage tail protein n=1 Tax=Mesorhizobium sp. LSJC269B00 TaxID=1287326 RepID=UPI0003CEF4DA|nr:phage tail protein [Mesorhizobium sp. LSJC269B00]ESW93132.1 phage tail protein [Mesorhizobium sp. LSJC269B00]